MRLSHARLVLAGLGTVLGGCFNVLMIPGTKVPDTKPNREIIAVCEKYRHALEDRDAETLLSMASKSYFED